MNTTIVNYGDGTEIKIRCETALEKWRAETAATKEPETLAWIRSFKLGETFLDIGANIGIYSLYAAKRHIPTVALEPHPGNHMALIFNHRLYNRGLPMRVLPGSAGAKDEMRDFWFTGVDAGSTGGSHEVNGGHQSRYVRVYTVDDLAQWYGPFSHIKIDVDGEERSIIRGMRKTLRNQAIQSCLVELNPRTKLPVTAEFLSAGYSIENEFNTMTPHSRERRAQEGIDVENIIFCRVP